MRYFLLAITLFHFTMVFGQITGTVVNEAEEEIPFANAVVMDAQGTFMVGDITDERGAFELPAPPPGSDYRLKISSLGFDEFVSQPFRISDSTSVLEFDRIVLRAAGIDLALAEVTARRRVLRQSAEGMVVDVAASLTNRGNTVLAVLEKSPGVFVDRRNGGLSLYGRGGVTVMIDGQRQQLPPAALLSFLESLPADEITSIELLDNPGAAYDADGGAVIHLHRKAVREPQTAGSLIVAAGYGYREKGSVGVQLGRGGRVFDWSGSYRLAYDHGLAGFNGNGPQNLSLLGGPIRVDFTNLTVSRRTDHNLSYRAQRRVGDRLTYGLNLSGQFNHDQLDNETFAAYTPRSGNTLPEFTNQVTVTSRVPRFTINPGLFVSHKPTGGGSTDVRVDYLRYGTSTDSDINNGVNLDAPEAENPIFTPVNRSRNQTAIDVVSLRSDLVRPVGKHSEMEVGVRIAHSVASNEGYLERLIQERWQTDPRTALQLRNREWIYAAYAGGNWKLGTTGKLSIAARYEYWIQQFSDATGDRYTGRLFPNLVYEHAFSESKRLVLSYSSRIERPTYQDLTANLAYSGPISFFSGNTSLRPATVQRYAARQQLGSLALSLAYVRERFPIARYQFSSDESGTFIVVLPQNVDYQNSIELQVTLPWDPTAWWSMSNTALVAYRKFALGYAPAPVEKSYRTLTLNTTQNFVLPGKFSLELSGWYNGGFYSGATQYRGFGAVNVGIRKDLPGSWGSLSLSVEDVGKLQQVRSSVGALRREVFDVELATVYRPESSRYRLFRLTYVRPLGSGEQGASRSQADQEEIRRLGQ